MITIKINSIEITINDETINVLFMDLIKTISGQETEIKITDFKSENPTEVKKEVILKVPTEIKKGGFKPKITENDPPEKQIKAIHNKRHNLKKAGMLTPEKEAELDLTLSEIKRKQNEYQIDDNPF